MPRPDYRYLEEGTYIITNRPRSLGESTHVIVYSKDYRRIWRYWRTNPDNLPDRDGWIICLRENGCNKIVKPIPPDRLRKYGHLAAAIGLFVAALDALDGKLDGQFNATLWACHLIGAHLIIHL